MTPILLTLAALLALAAFAAWHLERRAQRRRSRRNLEAWGRMMNDRDSRGMVCRPSGTYGWGNDEVVR